MVTVACSKIEQYWNGIEIVYKESRIVGFWSSRTIFFIE